MNRKSLFERAICADREDEQPDAESEQRPPVRLTAKQHEAAVGVQSPTTATNDEILQKRDQLKERFEFLISDIRALAAGAYFDTENWNDGRVTRRDTAPSAVNLSKTLENADPDVTKAGNTADTYEKKHERYSTEYADRAEWWTDLLDIDPRMESSKEVYLAVSDGYNDIVPFGYELGSALRTLIPDEADETDRFDLIWGIIVGMCGESWQNPAVERDRLDRLNDRIEFNRRQRSDEIDNLRPYTEDAIAAIKGEVNPAKAICEGISDAGIRPTFLVQQEVKKHLPILDEPTYNRKGARDLTEQLMEETPLGEIQKVVRYVEDDIDAVRDFDHRGIKPLEQPLRGLWNGSSQEAAAEGSANSDGKDRSPSVAPKVPIRDVCDYTKDETTACLRRLKNNDGDTTDDLTQVPLVSSEGDSRSSQWYLTDYGKLLAVCMFEHDGTAWLYRYALASDELALHERRIVSNALKHVGITSL